MQHLSTDKFVILAPYFEFVLVPQNESNVNNNHFGGNGGNVGLSAAERLMNGLRPFQGEQD